jgi:hypothetical protein
VQAGGAKSLRVRRRPCNEGRAKGAHPKHSMKPALPFDEVIRNRAIPAREPLRESGDEPGRHAVLQNRRHE